MDDVALLYAGSGRNLLILLLSGLRDPASKVIFPEAVPFWHGNAIQGYTTRWDGRFGACSSDGRGGGWDERERQRVGRHWAGGERLAGIVVPYDTLT